MKTVKGKFYIKFADETLQDAVCSHRYSLDGSERYIGFDSIEDARVEAELIQETDDKPEPYSVLDSNLESVFSKGIRK